MQTNMHVYIIWGCIIIIIAQYFIFYAFYVLIYLVKLLLQILNNGVTSIIWIAEKGFRHH